VINAWAFLNYWGAGARAAPKVYAYIRVGLLLDRILMSSVPRATVHALKPKKPKHYFKARFLQAQRCMHNIVLSC